MADFRRVHPGEPVTLGAAEWNAIVDAAIAEKGRRHSLTWGTSPHPDDGTIVRLRNDSGADLPRHSIVGIAGPLFSPSQSYDAFLEDVRLRGVVPTSTTKHNFAVLLEPIPSQGIGRAIVGGIAACKVNMVDAAHVSAEAVAGDTTRLQSVTGAGKPQNLLWAEAGTGTRWALVRQDVGDCGCAVEGSPCCGGGMPDVLYLTDDFGIVELVRDGPHPVIPPGVSFAPTGDGWWWGCAPRTAIGTAGSCAGTADLVTHVVFAFRCGAAPDESAFDLRLFAVGCRNTGGLQSFFLPGYDCDADWPTTQTDAAHIVPYRPTSVLAPATSCDPFSWTKSGVGYTQIYGPSVVWTVTE